MDEFNKIQSQYLQAISKLRTLTHLDHFTTHANAFDTYIIEFESSIINTRNILQAKCTNIDCTKKYKNIIDIYKNWLLLLISKFENQSSFVNQKISNELNQRPLSNILMLHTSPNNTIDQLLETAEGIIKLLVNSV